MGKITPELLADLKHKAERATSGNWFITCDMQGRLLLNCVACDRYESCIAVFPSPAYNEKDADYIAAANPETLSTLLAYIEKLQKENKRLLEIVKKYTVAAVLDR